MNKTEARYAERLHSMLLAGEIQEYKFHAITLKLANDTRYTPDFLVIRDDCIELHEVKGFMRDDAFVKLKVAAAMFPEFKFLLCKQKSKANPWDITEIF